jgi:GntR family transcriptional repressor for pyruvate dehydrogenase complex
MIEVEVAGLAAERATEENWAAMEAAIEGMTAHVRDAAQFVHHDLMFHSALADATHNDLFSVLLNAISDLWSKGALLAYQAPSAAEDSLAHHCSVLRHVKARDQKKARQAMREHIQHSQVLAEAIRHQMDD